MNPKMNEVSGHSDDCVEFESDKIRSEFYYDEDGDTYLAFSNGLVLSVEYAEGGIWRFHEVSNPNGVVISRILRRDDGYTERITFEGEVSWILMGKDFDTGRKLRK
jgi:hypothetical protein